MRRRVYLSSRYKAIISYTGRILSLVGCLILLPGILAFLNPEESGTTSVFFVSGSLTLILGTALWKLFRQRTFMALTVKEGGVIVLLSWVTACLCSALPLIFILNFTFTQGIFESVSGWTTTGLTLVDVTKAPASVLFWRSLMQYAGGAGLAIIMLAAITGPVGIGLTTAEGRTDQLAPHVRESAKLVIVLYLGYAVVGSVILTFAGMSPFDAVNHTLTAVATGGFSTHAESIAFFQSPLIEGIVLILMVIGNLNFLTAYMLLKGKWRAIYKNMEIRIFVFFALTAPVILYHTVGLGTYPRVWHRVRVCVFEAVSALTGTGFTITSYHHWTGTGFLVLIMLMIIGGGTCSTSGGLKQYRVYVLYKTIVWELIRPFYPRAAVVQHRIWQGEAPDYITDRRIRQISAFIFLYLLVFIIGSGILSTYGHSMKDSMFEFASALGTVGLSVGLTRAQSPPGFLWTETLGMFLGRLEFFIVIVSFLKIIRDIKLIIRPGKK